MAFYGTKQLRYIDIRTKKLKAIGKKAFIGIYPAAKIKIPRTRKSTSNYLPKNTVKRKKQRVHKMEFSAFPLVIHLKIAAVPAPVVHTVVSDINLISRDGKLFT